METMENIISSSLFFFPIYIKYVGRGAEGFTKFII